MRVAVSFTNFGPYHLARLRALALRLANAGGALIAIETAGRQAMYPWQAQSDQEGFQRLTLFPNQDLGELSSGEIRARMNHMLDAHQPDAVMVSGYVRPECLAAARWAKRNRRPAVLMSETQAIDHPRVWWKETIKRRRVAAFDSALVGGSRHRDYLIDLGMPAGRIALGYNAVDHDRIAAAVDRVRAAESGQTTPYFLTVCRLVPDKNLTRLLHAYANYRARCAKPWNLVICGDGPARNELTQLAATRGIIGNVSFPGFLQESSLDPIYAHASAFVLASTSEPWGLVVNEAAAAALPLLVSDRCGCAETLVPQPPGTTGWRFDPMNIDEMTESLSRMSALSSSDRSALGESARKVASRWGPERFAAGALEALTLAANRKPRQARRPVEVKLS